MENDCMVDLRHLTVASSQTASTSEMRIFISKKVAGNYV